MKKNNHPIKWMIWALAALFYFYEYFLRVAPGVMIPELMDAFSVDATAIGSLSAFYFYIYAPMQLPVGIMTDMYGARKLLAIAALVAGIGSLLFGLSSYYTIASLGRFLMGAGSSFAFVGLVFICSHWFPDNKRGILIGLGSTVGTLGAVFGEGPLEIMIEKFGWRSANIQLGIAGIALATLIYFVVRNDPPEMVKYDEKMRKPPENLFKNLKIVASNGYSWLVSLVCLFIYVTTPGFAALWGISFIKTAYSISTELAGFAVSMIFIGWAVGGPLIGHYSDKIQKKKPILIFSSLIGAILMGLIIYVTTFPLWLLFTLFFFVGFISAAQLLTYGYVIDINPVQTKGTATAFTNFMAILGGALAQPFVGFLLDSNWDGTIVGGARIYSIDAYKKAMTCFPITFLIAFILSLFLKHLGKKTLWQKIITP